jgi:hypothetical protein
VRVCDAVHYIGHQPIKCCQAGTSNAGGENKQDKATLNHSMSAHHTYDSQGVPIRCFWSRITYDTRMIRDTLSIRSCDTFACASSEQQQQG